MEPQRRSAGSEATARWLLVAGAALVTLTGTALAAAHASGSLGVGLGVAAIGCAAALALAHRVLARLARAHAELEDALRRLAAGEVATRLDAAALGEAAPLAEATNALGATLEAVVTRARAVVEATGRFPESAAAALQAVARGGESQEEAIEETAALLADINASIQAINAELESLSGATDEASASILQMGSSVDEVARSSGALHDSVDSSTASIHQVGASIRQVAASVDAVQGMAEETAAAIVQMDRAIREVSEHVREAAVLTERVSHEAEGGSGAVEATIDGIQSIRTHALASRQVLERLAQRIGEIGEILDVIGAINDETHLLSLNAAIIAAQAGEQGKAFAVVANHVKTLAQRTASSMQEIERLIRAVQEECSNVVRATDGGTAAVEAGVERSRRAGTALDSIRASAHDASSRVAEIARAAAEQTRNSKHVADAAQRTSEMVQQITTAMDEQQRASEQILRNAQAALELCGQVHRSTQEQRESGRFIQESMQAITRRIRAIRENTQSHARASEAVSGTVARILQVGRATGERLPALFDSLDGPRREAEALARELARLERR